MKLLCTNSSYQREREKIGWESGATEELRYSADFLSGCWCFSLFPWPVCPPPGFLCFFCGCCSESEDSVYENLGIQHSNSLCVISCLFSMYSEFISGQDALHTVLTVCTCTPCQRASFNSATDSISWGRDPYTLACKARPSFDRCGTSPSVPLSLSLFSLRDGETVWTTTGPYGLMSFWSTWTRRPRSLQAPLVPSGIEEIRPDGG